MEVWTEKYRPTSLREMVGSENLVGKVRRFLRSAFAELDSIRSKNADVRRHNAEIRSKNRGVPKSRRIKPREEASPDPGKVALLLRGPPGVGKTTVVHAAAGSEGIPIVESNASDERSVSKIRELIAPAASSSDITSFMTSGGRSSDRKIILIDEVDGISGGERGAASEIARVIEVTAYPVVMTANEWKGSLKPLYRICEEYQVTRPSSEEVVRLLRRIARKEGVEISPADLRSIAEGASGDFRAAINDLQLRYSADRDTLRTLFESLRAYFQAETAEDAEGALSGSTGDILKFFRWVAENAVARAKPERGKDLCRALALADSVAERILSVQEWSYFPQFVEILKGAATLAHDTGERLESPQWFRGSAKRAESAMNKHNISREEAETLLALLDD
jgi:DNA polymerase III delta prime subunit